jgi:hypothetical protein
MSRVAMSDMPSAALVTAVLWLFWSGSGTGPIRWVVAGLIACASVLLRETNPLIFVSLVVGAALRGEKNRWYLSSAFAAGLAIRFVFFDLVFGDPFFVKRSRDGFDVTRIPVKVLHGFVAIEVLILGFVLVALTYRGVRRPEILISLVCFLITITRPSRHVWKFNRRACNHEGMEFVAGPDIALNLRQYA